MIKAVDEKQPQQQTKKDIHCSLQYPLIFLHILVLCRLMFETN